MRWIVGDIQGCALELEALLEKIRFDPDRDELWCLGDLINRGPDSLAVMRLWQDVGGRALLGNHEINALLAFSGAKRTKSRGLEDLLRAPDAEDLLGALRALPVLVDLPSEGSGPDAWIVHAGLDPRWKDLSRRADSLNRSAHDDRWLTSAEVRFATGVRCCNAQGECCRHTGAPEDCPKGFRPWDTFYRGSRLVIHGHWASRGYYRTERTMGLDSACVYGGHLTAWCQEEDRIVQVAARRLP